MYASSRPDCRRRTSSSERPPKMLPETPPTSSRLPGLSGASVSSRRTTKVATGGSCSSATSAATTRDQRDDAHPGAPEPAGGPAAGTEGGAAWLRSSRSREAAGVRPSAANCRSDCRTGGVGHDPRHRGSPCSDHPRRRCSFLAVPDDRSFACFAAAAPGLEPLVAGELQALGELHPLRWIRPSREAWASARISRDSTRPTSTSAIASRVLVRVGALPRIGVPRARAPCRSAAVGGVRRAGGPVAFRVTSRKSRLYHQDAIARAAARRAAGAPHRASAEPARRRSSSCGSFATSAP